MISRLNDRWKQLVHNYSQDEALIAELFDELVKAYSSPARHYHDLVHIDNMMQGAIERKGSIDDADSLMLAIWYHDVVYNSLKGDNEEKSAEAAAMALKKLNYPAAGVDKVKRMILRTKNHMEKQDDDADTCLLLDLDLAVLGADRERYREYMKQVRQEYAWVPGFMYRKGRKKVLQQFLDGESIYRIGEFKEKLEEKARENLRYELDELSR